MNGNNAPVAAQKPTLCMQLDSWILSMIIYVQNVGVHLLPKMIRVPMQLVLLK